MLNVINNASDDRWTSVEGPQNVGRPKVKTREAIHTKTFLHSMRGRIWLLLQVSSPAALFPRVCWECVKACQTVGDQLIIASYWGPG